ncbi:MAG: hypothetical protein Q9182_002189 [Xanthomendoza sp. 2 TL-2023]
MAEHALAVPGASIHLYGKRDARPGRKMGHVTVVTDDMNEAASRMATLINLADLIKRESINPQPEPPHIEARQKDSRRGRDGSIRLQGPLVALTMGSKSDSSVLASGVKLLEQLEIPFTVTITSAHRTPEKMMTFAKEAADKGIKRGCPVATVAINNSINAAQLAVRILATSDVNAAVRERLKRHLEDQTRTVLEDSVKMERLGFEAFCSQG